jgi:hypothetical protein
MAALVNAPTIRPVPPKPGTVIVQPTPPSPTPTPEPPAPWPTPLDQSLPTLITLDGAALPAPTDGLVRPTPPKPPKPA